jgi:hypothetical protein
MYTFKFQDTTIIIPDEYSTEAVEAFIGVLAEANLETLAQKLVQGFTPELKSDGNDLKINLAEIFKGNWLSPILDAISNAGLIHKAAACALYEVGIEDFRPEVIVSRRELTRKLPLKITIPAVINFLSFVIESIRNSMTLLKKSPKDAAGTGKCGRTK